MVVSADGRGRTLFEILTGRNKKDQRPVEFQHHNPLKAKVGGFITIDEEPDVADIRFSVDAIAVYETKIGSKSFFHTDYYLKGTALDASEPIRYRLRLIADENVENKLRCRIQLLRLYTTMEQQEAEESNFASVLSDPEGVFYIDYDDEGNQYTKEQRPTYWRIKGIIDPYHASVVFMKDTDGNGSIDDEELERSNMTSWEYHRDTTVDSVKTREYLSIEMNDETGFYTFLRGGEVLQSQIGVF